MLKTGLREILVNSALVLAGGLILCAPAFYNGFPILTSDSGTYINCGFTSELPVDRPIAYGIFLRHISLAVSLWIPLLVQAILTSLVIFSSLQNLFPRPLPKVLFLPALALLSAVSALALDASQLMTDGFAPLIPLLACLILFAPGLARWKQLAYACLLVFILATHLSHLISFAAMTGVFIFIAFLLRKRDKRNLLRKSFRIATIIPFTLVFILLINRVSGKEWEISPKGRPVFMMGKLFSSGLMQDFLSENCESKNYAICRYKDWQGYDFLWTADSPLNQEYGWENHGWERAAKAYQPVIDDFFSSPRYFFSFAGNSIVSTGTQLVHMKMIQFEKQDEHSAPAGAIKWRFPGEYDAFLHSRQNQEGISFHWLNPLMPAVTVLSVLFLSAAWVRKKIRKASSYYSLVLSCLLFIILNAWACSTFAMVDDRYQYRVLWLLPFLLIGLVSDRLQIKRKD